MVPQLYDVGKLVLNGVWCVAELVIESHNLTTSQGNNLSKIRDLFLPLFNSNTILAEYNHGRSYKYVRLTINLNLYLFLPITIK